MSVRQSLPLRSTVFEEQDVEEPSRSGTTTYLSGEVIADRYRLVRELGRGGMGVVWQARSLALEVDVALKLLRVKGSETEMANRMAREAHAAARLAHPALVRVFDFGTTVRGHPFLVMELAQGETLSTVLAREGRMGAIRAVQMLLPVADGLRCAHEGGIVHRDVKPDNLFIAQDPFGRLQPKLIDFGIARVQSATEQRLTREGVVLGSPAYMSPEQARGEEGIDGQADLWAMCVMLYEMMTGQTPFQNENYNALMQAILHKHPVPTHTLGAGDADLWQAIAKGLAKSPELRYADATELGGALALWLYRHGVKEDVCGNSIRALWLHPRQVEAARPRGAPAAASRQSETRANAHDTGADDATRAVEIRWAAPWRARARWLTLMAGLASAVLAASWIAWRTHGSAGATTTLAPVRVSAPAASREVAAPPPNAEHATAAPGADAPLRAAAAARSDTPATSAVSGAAAATTIRRTPAGSLPSPRPAAPHAEPYRDPKATVHDFGF